MNVSQLRSLLLLHPDSLPRFVLPDGEIIPAHVHITEVGYVAKRFIDCGSTIRESSTCVLQAWESGQDLDHRLTAGRVASILDLADQVLPAKDLEVEVEYESCSVAQYPLTGGEFSGSELILSLAAKHTDCLAKEACGIGCRADCETERGCC